MDTIRPIDCHRISFSTKLSEERMVNALRVFGAGVILKILSFALYLLGANRTDIGQSLGIPTENVKSSIRSLLRDGLGALEDRRRRLSNFLPKTSPQPPTITLKKEEEQIVIDLGGNHLTLYRRDPLLLRCVLLSMLNNNLLEKQQVADAIGLSPAHTAILAEKLNNSDALSLVDQREGPKHDFRVTPEVKAELIQQFAVDIITEGRATSDTISSELLERCRITVPARTVRHHLALMGLTKIKHSLPQLVAKVKKTSKD